jgi:hypothetical protein
VTQRGVAPCRHVFAVRHTAHPPAQPRGERLLSCVLVYLPEQLSRLDPAGALRPVQLVRTASADSGTYRAALQAARYDLGHLLVRSSSPRGSQPRALLRLAARGRWPAGTGNYRVGPARGDLARCAPDRHQAVGPTCPGHFPEHEKARWRSVSIASGTGGFGPLLQGAIDQSLKARKLAATPAFVFGARRAPPTPLSSSAKAGTTS